MLLGRWRRWRAGNEIIEPGQGFKPLLYFTDAKYRIGQEVNRFQKALAGHRELNTGAAAMKQ